MPGGPIDPDIIANAIHGGATWTSNHLTVAGASKWLAIDTAGRWILNASPACLIDEDTYNAIRTALPPVGGYFTIGTERRKLAPVVVSGSTWASLVAP